MVWLSLLGRQKLSVAHKQAGENLCALGKWSSALAELLEGRFDRGAYLSLRRYDEAVVDFTEAIKLRPDVAFAYCDRAVGYFHKGAYGKAIEHDSEGIRRDPGLAFCYSNRGSAKVKRGDYEQAIDDLTEALRLDPGNARAYFQRGQAYSLR